MRFLFHRRITFSILFLFFWIGCLFCMWKLGKYIREKDCIVYSEELKGSRHENWEIAMREGTFPDCFDTRMALRAYDGLEKDEEEKRKLLEELEFKIKQEREKLEKRKEVAFKRDKLRLIQVLIEPNH